MERGTILRLPATVAGRIRRHYGGAQVEMLQYRSERPPFASPGVPGSVDRGCGACQWSDELSIMGHRQAVAPFLLVVYILNQVNGHFSTLTWNGALHNYQTCISCPVFSFAPGVQRDVAICFGVFHSKQWHACSGLANAGSSLSGLTTGARVREAPIPVDVLLPGIAALHAREKQLTRTGSGGRQRK